MEAIFNYILLNKTWIFSGVGGSILFGIWSLLKRRGVTTGQKQNAGDHSINIQSGHDVKIHNVNANNEK